MGHKFCVITTHLEYRSLELQIKNDLVDKGGEALSQIHHPVKFLQTNSLDQES